MALISHARYKSIGNIASRKSEQVAPISSIRRSCINCLISYVNYGVFSFFPCLLLLFSGTEKMTKNYSKNFAYGCLYEIPIPNTTLDTTFTPEQEKAVLMELFNQTKGHNWENNTFWGNDSVSHCLWYGITCDNTSHSYVISISLVENNLRGSLPGTLWKLRNLQGLCVYGNSRLTGKLDTILSANMTALLRLDLAFNKISSTIPSAILVRMESLVKIQLCCQMGRGLSGEIPRDIGNLTDLQVLSLGQNNVSGSIPKSIGRLKKLWFLDLETATLSGGFENLFKLSSLRYLHVSLAGLQGSLPDEFGLFFPSMRQCLLSGNHFTGKIPSTMGNMTNLEHLDLANNHFWGQIPKSIGSLAMLQVADFSENQFTSLQPGIKFESQSMEVLLLAGNHNLTVNFNVLLEALEPINGSLSILNVSDCNFFGTISTKLWDFRNLIFVDLENNSLSGELPKPTDNFFMVLLHLDVSGNNLSGEIPAQFARLQELQFLDVSENPLMHEIDEDEEILPKYMRVDFTTLTRRNPSEKFKCPNARLNYNDGLVVLDPRYYRYRFCICDIGYYGSGKVCLPCMKGAVCKNQKLHDQRMVMNAGYWPSSRGDENVTHLVKCSQKLGFSSRESTPCNPTGACDCGIVWFKKGNKTETRPATVCRMSCLCRKGSKDRFCSRCEDGYFKQGILCYTCPKAESTVYILIALVLTMVILTLAFVLYTKKRLLSVLIAFAQITILFVLAMFRIIPGWFLEINTIVLIVGLAGRGKASRGILKISIFYLQTLDALISNTDIWPREVLQAQHYMSSVFNLHFSGFACVFPTLFTPLGEILLLILLPVMCILCFWLYFAIGRVLHRLWNPLDRLFPSRNSCLQLTIISLNLTYFPIVKKTASVLAHCDEDSSHRYLREAPWQECEGHVYTTLQALGWLALVLYVGGIPFGVFLPLLLKYARTRDELARGERETLDSWLGSIYLPYKKGFRSYFEILFLMRRMLIAFSLSFIPRASPFQTIAVCSVLLASLCFQAFFRPFVNPYQNIPFENAAETVVLLILHFSFMNIRYAVLNPKSSTSIVWMLMISNLIVLFFIVISIIVLLGRVAHAVPNGERASAETSHQGPDIAGTVSSSARLVEDVRQPS